MAGAAIGAAAANANAGYYYGSGYGYDSYAYAPGLCSSYDSYATSRPMPRRSTRRRATTARSPRINYGYPGYNTNYIGPWRERKLQGRDY